MMILSKYSLLVWLIIGASFVNAQSFSRVKVLLNEQHTIEQLAQLGIAVDHGELASQRFYINDLSRNEIYIIQNNGFELEVLIEDVVAYYQDPNRVLTSRDDVCVEKISPYAVPANFELGSMAGFYTWEELLDILDDMHSKFPNLITMKAPIEGHLSHEGRPIYQIKISDQPNTEEEGEPEVLYTALHHAREPNSLTQMIYYMWYVLENHETDDNIKYLLDNTALHFIPCVNPDGYVYNQTTNPEGGGLWRKNRKVFEGDTVGVDLNRNYGYRWGFDDSGSSPAPESQTYRGHLPFSEPETKAVRAFCNAHNFVAAFNYHTYGNLLIYPWGFSDMPTADSLTFFAISQAMTLENNYVSGTGTTTVGYTVNGDSDDWMYGEESSKPAILSMTPEVGTAGFWPAPNQIIPQCKNTVLMNHTLAQIPHTYAYIKNKTPQTFQNGFGAVSFDIQRIGLADGNFSVQLIPLTENINAVGDPKNYSLLPNEIRSDSITFILEDAISNGEDFSFILEWSTAVQTWQDTIHSRLLILSPIFVDINFTPENWTFESENKWVQTEIDYFSINTAIKESPEEVYPPDLDADIISQPFTIPSNSGQVFVEFRSKWDIEKNYDYAQVLLSVNDGIFFPLCGAHSNLGGFYQALDQPLYDGRQLEWILETIEISDFVNVGDEIKVKFLFHSDSYQQGGGIYIDDFVISVVPSGVSTSSVPHPDFAISQNTPNPAQRSTAITISSKAGTFSERGLFVYNILGQVIFHKKLNTNPIEVVEINTSNWESGIYFYRLQTDRLFSPWKKINISK